MRASTYEVIVGVGGNAGPGFCASEDQLKNGYAFLGYIALGGVEKEVQGREATGADGEAGIVIIRHKICKVCSTGMYSFRSSSSRCSFEFSCN